MGNKKSLYIINCIGTTECTHKSNINKKLFHEIYNDGCIIKSCKNKDKCVMAHVHLNPDKSDDILIIKLCRSHNYFTNKKPMEISFKYSKKILKTIILNKCKCCKCSTCQN